MRLAIIGDMHLGVKNGNNDFLQFQLVWLEDCLKKLQNMGITTIVQTGDFFDTRAHIKLNVLHEVLYKFPALLNKYGIREWVTYGGNHDMFYRDSNDICSIEILNFLNKQDSVKFTTYTNKIGYSLIGGNMFAFVPWVNKNNFEELITLDLLQGPAEYVFGHFEIIGMPMIPGVLCEHGVEPKDFQRFKRVISGHFHTVSTSLNCTMVGTPYHITWGDVQDGNNRGFWTLDTETDTLELHKNDEFMTMFSVIEYNSEETYDAKYFEPYTGTIVKVMVRDKPDAKHFKKFIELLAKCEFIDYKIIDTTMVLIEKVEISEETLSLDTLSAMNAFIDGQSDDMNKVAVKALAKQIYLEVVNGG